MSAKRSSIPTRTKKQLLQETNCKCPFCDYNEVADLEIHHIQEWSRGGKHDFENLIMVCPNCHTQITQGVISEADILLKKRMLKFQTPPKTESHPSQSNVFIGSKVEMVAQTVNITGKRNPKIAHPLGSIGADLPKKNYIAYLIEQYFKFRDADKSFGAYEHAGKFNHAEIHRTINSKFKAKTYFVPLHRFPALAEFIQHRIDQTILGKRNLAKRSANYTNFEKFLIEHG